MYYNVLIVVDLHTIEYVQLNFIVEISQSHLPAQHLSDLGYKHDFFPGVIIFF